MDRLSGDTGPDHLGRGTAGAGGLIACGVIAILGAVAVLHVIWALRIWWPLADEAALARTVVGSPGITLMPGAPITWAVAAVLVAGMVLVAALAGWIILPGPVWMLRAGGWGMALVLLARGLATYLPFVSRWPLEQPFARLNRALYSPLITALGLGVVALLL
ncbi:MAG TPA: DUF3995 domain-containing protein [Aliiroseovarius sp.]|nr:DUF3995 domain-containing protein [Aliiroseovarius sp.]